MMLEMFANLLVELHIIYFHFATKDDNLVALLFYYKDLFQKTFIPKFLRFIFCEFMINICCDVFYFNFVLPCFIKYF